MLKVTQRFNTRRIARIDSPFGARLLIIGHSLTNPKSLLVAELLIILGGTGS